MRQALKTLTKEHALLVRAVDGAGQLARKLFRGEGENAVPGADCATPGGYQLAKVCGGCTELNPISAQACFCGKEFES
jgi:hypothetical protein